MIKQFTKNIMQKIIPYEKDVDTGVTKFALVHYWGYFIM